MKILQMNPAFYPASAYGGTVEVSYRLSKELVRRGHEVTVYTSDTLDKYHRQKDRISEFDGIKVYYFKNISNKLAWHRFIFTPGMLPQLRKELKNFDIIHLHGSRNFQNIFAHYYAKKYVVPYVLQAHGSIPYFGNPIKQSLKWIYDVFFGYRLLRGASKVIALNGDEAEQYRSMGVRDEKIEVIPNGIDLTEYTDLPPRGSFKERYNIPLESKLILYLGRIHQSKGIDLLIKSFSVVLERMTYGSTILVLIGPDDGYMGEAKSLAESLGILDSVLFTGFVSAEDKCKALVDADMFVTPSFSGFPMTFLEACVSGTPIITTTLGDNLGWIHGKAGYVTLPTSSDLSDAMYRLLTDDDLREKFSENCRAVIRSEFTLDIIVDKFIQLYGNIIE